MGPLLAGPVAVAFSLLADDVVTPDPDTVTPGVVGFIVTFLVIVATLLLVLDMVRRVRRVNYRDQVQAELQAEVAARDAAASGTTPDASGNSPEVPPAAR